MAIQCCFSRGRTIVLGGGEVFMVVWDCNRTIVTSFLIFHIKIIVSLLGISRISFNCKEQRCFCSFQHGDFESIGTWPSNIQAFYDWELESVELLLGSVYANIPRGSRLLELEVEWQWSIWGPFLLWAFQKWHWNLFSLQECLV